MIIFLGWQWIFQLRRISNYDWCDDVNEINLKKILSEDKMEEIQRQMIII